MIRIFLDANKQNSIKIANINVEIKLLTKKGIASMYVVTKPGIFKPYIPDTQTPKLVIIKNIKAPKTDPIILVLTA